MPVSKVGRLGEISIFPLNKFLDSGFVITSKNESGIKWLKKTFDVDDDFKRESEIVEVLYDPKTKICYANPFNKTACNIALKEICSDFLRLCRDFYFEKKMQLSKADLGLGKVAVMMNFFYSS